jgi:hypothetical protein
VLFHAACYGHAVRESDQARSDRHLHRANGRALRVCWFPRSEPTLLNSCNFFTDHDLFIDHNFFRRDHSNVKCTGRISSRAGGGHLRYPATGYAPKQHDIGLCRRK